MKVWTHPHGLYERPSRIYIIFETLNRRDGILPNPKPFAFLYLFSNIVQRCCVASFSITFSLPSGLTSLTS